MICKTYACLYWMKPCKLHCIVLPACLIRPASSTSIHHLVMLMQLPTDPCIPQMLSMRMRPTRHTMAQHLNILNLCERLGHHPETVKNSPEQEQAWHSQWPAEGEQLSHGGSDSLPHAVPLLPLLSNPRWQTCQVARGIVLVGGQRPEP